MTQKQTMKGNVKRNNLKIINFCAIPDYSIFISNYHG